MIAFEDETECRLCNVEQRSSETLRRHLRVHSTTYQAYTLKWKHNGVMPICLCGCGTQTNWNVALKDFARYADGHGGKSTVGRPRTAAEKAAIGFKNSINTTRWIKENPEEAYKKIAVMLAALSPDVMAKRLDAVRETYRHLTLEQRLKFSDHAKSQWEKQRPLMNEAHKKAANTFKQRASAGQYDFTTRNENLSKSITQLYLSGGFQWCVGDYTSTKTGEQIFYRSSWELEYAKLLDADVSVKSWKYEPFSVDYVLNNKLKQYIPDFLVEYVDGVIEIVEVKPRELENSKMNSAKRLAILEMCNSRGWRYASWSTV